MRVFLFSRPSKGLFHLVIALGISLSACPSRCAAQDPAATAAFWKWFSENSARFGGELSYEASLVDYAERGRLKDPAQVEKGGQLEKGQIRNREISARLKLVHPEFSHTCYHGTRDRPPRIAITVDGRAQYFAAVDSFVARAPKMEGLRVIALKDPWPGDMRSLEGAGMGSLLNSKWGDLWYSREPREGGTFAYIVYAPDKVPSDREGFRKSVAFTLALCFGERLGATLIHSVEVRQLNGAPPYTGLRRFTDAQAEVMAKKE